MSTIERSVPRRPRTIDRPLRPTGILTGCSRRELAAIARHCDVVEVDAGACVQEMQPLHWVYIVVDGLLAATNADRMFLAGPDGAIGARSAMASKTDVASITAMETSTFVVTTVPEFAGLVADLRGLARRIDRYLTLQPGTF